MSSMSGMNRIALLQQWRPPDRIIRMYPIAFPEINYVLQIIIKVILGSFHTEICQKYSNPNFIWWSDYWNVYEIIYLRGFILTSFSVKIYLTLHQNTYYKVYIPETSMLRLLYTVFLPIYFSYIHVYITLMRKFDPEKTLVASQNSPWSRLHFFSILWHFKTNPGDSLPICEMRVRNWSR